jgi:hypothetical protein
LLCSYRSLRTIFSSMPVWHRCEYRSDYFCALSLA